MSLNDTTHPITQMTCIPALDDNYIWIITQGVATFVVDPGESRPVIDWLNKQQRKLTAILITHTHHDHIDGVCALLQAYPNTTVYAHPQAIVPFTFTALCLGQRLTIAQLTIDVLDLSGHTPDHIGFYLEQQQALFCGDALFAGGCGRLFNGGTAAQMTATLQRIASLPRNTYIFCAHEYTLANLRFAQISEPNNTKINDRLAQVIHLRQNNQPSVPSTLNDEFDTNPFLRTEEATLHQAIDEYAGIKTDNRTTRFAQLRAWKDHLDATGQLELAP